MTENFKNDFIVHHVQHFANLYSQHLQNVHPYIFFNLLDQYLKSAVLREKTNILLRVGSVFTLVVDVSLIVEKL